MAFGRCGRASGGRCSSSGHRSSASEIKIGEREEREHLRSVFGDAAIADLAVAEPAFQLYKYVLDRTVGSSSWWVSDEALCLPSRGRQHLFSRDRQNVKESLHRGWDRDWTSVNVSPKTAETYRHHLKHARRHTIGHVHRILHRAFGHAVLWKLISRNPAGQAEPPPVPDQKSRS